MHLVFIINAILNSRLLHRFPILSVQQLSYKVIYKQYNMKKHLLVFLLLLLLQIIYCQKISAQLYIITYSPLYFNLTFSQPTPLPKFQLLFNQIPINYSIQTNNKGTNAFYIIQGLTKGIVNPSDYITEKYVLMFTQPLTIAGGSLNLDSFLLRAIKSVNQTEYVYQPLTSWDSQYENSASNNALNALARIITFMTYFLAFSTFIGLRAFNFLGIYIFISLQFPLFTQLDYRIAFYLLFSPQQIKYSQVLQFIYMMIPHFLVLFTFVIGVLSRFFLQKLAHRSGLWNYIYYYLTYKLFIITWGMMIIPLYANMNTLIKNKGFFTQIDHRLVYFYIYLNAASIAFYSYMAFFTTNPQIGQTPEKWNTYVQTSHYQILEGFHLGSDPKDWKKRNFPFLISILRLVIFIFISVNIIGIPNLLCQILYLIYLFTLRPFKYDFFNYFSIGIQVFVIVFYLYRYIVDLYMGISQQITTSTDITRILLTNVIILSIISFSYFILGIYELYQRIRSFRITMKSWSRQAKYSRNQGGIRKAKHSAFKKQQQGKEQRQIKRKHHKKVKKTSPSRQGVPNIKITQTIRKQPQSAFQRPLKSLTSQKQQKKQVKYQNASQNKSVSGKSNSPKTNKPTRRLKQKSSLLQSISLGHQSP